MAEKKTECKTTKGEKHKKNYKKNEAIYPVWKQIGRVVTAVEYEWD